MISVCVPYWKQRDQLDAMIVQYARLYGWHDMELVVACDGSQYKSPVSWLRVVCLPLKVSRARSTRLHGLRSDHPLNPCVPINAAVAASHGDVIVLTGCEIEHEGDVLGPMLECLEHEDDYVVSPCYDERRGWLAGPHVDYNSGGRLPVPPGGHFHFCAMLHRSLWDKAGGFDEDYRHGQACDDNDWLWRLADVGARFKLSPTLVIHRPSPPIAWNLPHNRDLFMEKWPDERRAAICARDGALAGRVPT